MPETPNLGSPYDYPNYPGDPPYFKAAMDTRARRIYEYLNFLWDENKGPARIDILLNLAQQSPQDELRALLAEPPLKLELPDDVVCAVIDLATGRLATPPGAKADGKFYMLMLPAKPSQGPANESYDSFKASQQWIEAFYHGVRQSGGM